MDIAAIISKNLTAWMAATPGLDTLQKLEAKSGIGFGTIRRAKNGDGNITVEKLTALAAAFGRTPAELMAPEQVDEPTGSPTPEMQPDAALEQMSVEARAKILVEQASEVSSLWMALTADRRTEVLQQLRAEAGAPAGNARPLKVRDPRKAAPRLTKPDTKGHREAG